MVCIAPKPMREKNMTKKTKENTARAANTVQRLKRLGQAIRTTDALKTAYFDRSIAEIEAFNQMLQLNTTVADELPADSKSVN